MSCQYHDDYGLNPVSWKQKKSRGRWRDLTAADNIRDCRSGRSMEEEALNILRMALYHQSPAQEDLASAIRVGFASLGGVELDIPPRSPMHKPPRFD